MVELGQGQDQLISEINESDSTPESIRLVTREAIEEAKQILAEANRLGLDEDGSHAYAYEALRAEAVRALNEEITVDRHNYRQFITEELSDGNISLTEASGISNSLEKLKGAVNDKLVKAGTVQAKDFNKGLKVAQSEARKAINPLTDNIQAQLDEHFGEIKINGEEIDHSENLIMAFRNSPQDVKKGLLASGLTEKQTRTLLGDLDRFVDTREGVEDKIKIEAEKGKNDAEVRYKELQKKHPVLQLGDLDTLQKIYNEDYLSFEKTILDKIQDPEDKALLVSILESRKTSNEIVNDIEEGEKILEKQKKEYEEERATEEEKKVDSLYEEDKIVSPNDGEEGIYSVVNGDGGYDVKYKLNGDEDARTITITKDEFGAFGTNVEGLNNLVSFRETLEDLNLNFIWENRTEYLRAVEEVNSTGANNSAFKYLDPNSISKVEMKKVLDFTLSVLGDREVNPSLGTSIMKMRNVSGSWLDEGKENAMGRTPIATKLEEMKIYDPDSSVVKINHSRLIDAYNGKNK